MLQPQDLSLLVRWDKILLGLGEFIATGTLATLTGGSSSASFVKAVRDIVSGLRIEESTSSKALALAVLSIASSIDKLRPQGQHLMPEGFATTLKNLALSAVTNEQYCTMPHSFFQRPVDLPLFDQLKPKIVEALLLVRKSDEATEGLTAKLESAFSISVYEIMQIRREYFLPVLHALTAPGVDPAISEFEWSKYRMGLISKFEIDPVFGQEETKVSLSQLYVPCRAQWGINDDDIDEDENIVDLSDEMISWIKFGSKDDHIRLLSGGPGSGKSSFMKYFASVVARDETYIPIFIELQKLKSFVDLKKAIEKILFDEGVGFKQSPFDNIGTRCVVILFDGLDELVVPGGEAANRTAESFANALVSLIDNYSYKSTAPIRAVVSGRTVIANVFAETLLQDTPRALLEIQGFVGTGRKLFDRRYDLRPDWWRKYASAFGLSPETPMAYKVRELRDITNEPLLCYLLALSGYALGKWQEVASNHNLIYDRLLGEVWERRWGKTLRQDSGRVGPALSLRKRSDFDVLMEAMALAAWWGGENRIATKALFEEAIKMTGAQIAWEQFKKDNGDEVGNLALTFYFKNNTEDSQGIEFTHKSFSEYLVSRLLFRTLVKRLGSPLDAGEIELSEASQRWTRVASGGVISDDMKAFLWNEAISCERSVLSVAFVEGGKLLRRLIAKGISFGAYGTDDLPVIWEKNCAAVTNLSLCLQAIGRRSPRNEFGLVDLAGGSKRKDRDKTSFIRMCSEFYVTDRSSDLMFSGFKLDSVFLNGTFLVNADFSTSRLRRANFVSSNLSNANFAGADLSAANFSKADLSGVDFRGATLQGANFERAYVNDAIFDFNWYKSIDPRTYENWFIGHPRICLEDGSVIGPRDEGYLHLGRKRRELRRYARSNRYTFPTFYDDRPFPD